MSLFGEDFVRRIAKMVGEYAERDRNALDRQFGDSPPIDHEEVDDQTFMAWFEDQVRAHPPVVMTFPDGLEITESPWPVMLAAADGDLGKQILRRWERVSGRQR